MLNFSLHCTSPLRQEKNLINAVSYLIFLYSCIIDKPDVVMDIKVKQRTCMRMKNKHLIKQSVGVRVCV